MAIKIRNSKIYSEELILLQSCRIAFCRELSPDFSAGERTDDSPLSMGWGSGPHPSSWWPNGELSTSHLGLCLSLQSSFHRAKQYREESWFLCEWRFHLVFLLCGTGLIKMESWASECIPVLMAGAQLCRSVGAAATIRPGCTVSHWV